MNCRKLYTRTVLFFLAIKVYVALSNLRIIGGRDPLVSEFPYVVRLQVVSVNMSANPKTFCSASVLTATWTLSTAHCIQFIEKYTKKHPNIVHKNIISIEPISNSTSFRTLSGTDPFSNGNPSPIERKFEILSFHKHPAYRGFIYDDLIVIDNDIGLLHTESVSLKQYARLSAVDFSTVTGQEAVAVGYGVSVVMTKGGQNISVPRPLKVLDVIVVKCPKLWHLYPALCVAHQCGQKPTLCGGDSGGPLIHPSGIIAITSVNYAQDCKVDGNERSNIVGIFTAVSPYITWITSHIINDQETTDVTLTK